MAKKTYLATSQSILRVHPLALKALSTLLLLLLLLFLGRTTVSTNLDLSMAPALDMYGNPSVLKANFL